MKKTVKILLCIMISILILSLYSCKKSPEKSGNMTNEIFEFTFKIDDVTYTLPQSIEKFTDNGWQFPENFDGFDSIVKSKGLKETYLENGDNWFAVEIFNNSDNDTELKKCPIGRLIYDFSGDIKITMAGDFVLNGKTLDEVIKKYGEPLSQKDYSTYTEVIYDKDPSEGIYDRYTLRFDLDSKVIKNFDIVYYYG